MSKEQMLAIVTVVWRDKPATLRDAVDLVERKFGATIAAEFWNRSLLDLLGKLPLIDACQLVHDKPATLRDAVDLAERKFGATVAAEFWNRSMLDLLGRLPLIDVCQLVMKDQE
jgi:hypothetical protein